MLTMDGRETEKEIKLSIERIIDLVREVRNGLIADFLEDATIKSYFHEQYNKEISQVKTEFLKRDLKELMNSPIDLPHYSSLIKAMQEQNSASLTATNHDLFYRELERIFHKYSY